MNLCCQLWLLTGVDGKIRSAILKCQDEMASEEAQDWQCLLGWRQCFYTVLLPAAQCFICRAVQPHLDIYFSPTIEIGLSTLRFTIKINQFVQ